MPGSAGRIAPGGATASGPAARRARSHALPPPEIASALIPTGLALELAIWGAPSPDPAEMAFLTQPPAPALAEARALLTGLGALDDRGPPHRPGRALVRLCRSTPASATCSPKLPGGCASSDLAALVEARDPLRGARPPTSRCRLDALRRPRRTTRSLAAASAPRRRRLRALAARTAPARGPGLAPGAALSLAYPDRIGQRRPGPAPRYLLAGGKGAALPPERSARDRAAARRRRSRRRPARGGDPPRAAGRRGGPARAARRSPAPRARLRVVAPRPRRAWRASA